MNKKLIKTIASITSGLGIAASIPFVITSCGSSPKDVVPSNALPYEVYEIQNNILLGFKEGIDFSQYEDDYDTIQIPSNVTKIEREAFYKNSTTTIPPFIKNLTFAKNSNCSSIGDQVFKNCTSLTSVSLPSSLARIEYEVFSNCPNLSKIVWDAWKGPDQTDLQSTSFSGVCPNGGTVTVTNPSGYDSIKLLNSLIDSAGMPIDWGLALPSDVYDIDGENFLNGFTKEFLDNRDTYSDYRIMEIPAKVKQIASTAFFATGITKIPGYIKKLTFKKESNLTEISGGAFRGENKSPLKWVDLSNCSSLVVLDQDCFYRCPQLSSVQLPGSLNTILYQCFAECNSLNSIVWDKISANPTIYDDCFKNIASSGVVKITNPVQGYTSSDLLTFLKTKGLPANWTAE